MTDYGASDTSTTALGANQFPIGEVYVPSGTQTPAAGGALTALEGGPASTDSATPAKRSAPASMYIKDGNNVTFGAEADAAITDSTQTTKTHMAFLKGLVKIFADVWDSVNHFILVKATQSGTWTVQPGNTANTTAWKVDGSAVTQPVSGTVTETNSGSIKTDLDTLAGIVSSSKAATKAASGDYVDGAIVGIGTTTQAKATDGTTTSWSMVQLLKGIFDKLLGTLAVTPYTNATAWPTGASNATAPLVTAGLNDGGIIQGWRDGGNISASGNNGAGIGTVAEFLFNGTTYDARTNNTELTLLASAARTTTQTLADQTNLNGLGVMVVLDVTTAGTGSITLEIDMKDPASGKYIALLTGAAVTTAVTNIYTVHPGITATANVSASQVLPRTWRVKITANNANTITYSCGAVIIV